MSNANENRKQLSEKWSEYLADQKETGMDYQTGDVVLSDGTLFRDVAFVGSALIGEVKGYEKIPFDPGLIAEIHLTHKRWKFKR